jgi:hypothetical protein
VRNLLRPGRRTLRALEHDAAALAAKDEALASAQQALDLVQINWMC